jgi:hypothetical protein
MIVQSSTICPFFWVAGCSAQLPPVTDVDLHGYTMHVHLLPF